MTLLQQANHALREHQYTTAIAQYRQLLAEQPGLRAVVLPSLRILERRLQSSAEAAAAANLREVRALLAASAQFRLEPSAVPPAADPSAALARAEQAAARGDWGRAVADWQAVLQVANPPLDAGALTRLSQRLFQVDAFPLAHQALERALAKEPRHPEALRVQKDQYYYHAYSAWLMETTEARADWHRADGLAERPDWATAVGYCRPFVRQPRARIHPHDLRQWTQAGLLWAEDAWDRHDPAHALDRVRETLAPLTDGLPAALTDALVAAVAQARAPVAAGDVASAPAGADRLREALTDLAPGARSVAEWLCLNDVLNWNGLLQLGYLARQHAVDQALALADAADAAVASLLQGARAALDQGDTARAGAFLDRVPAGQQAASPVAELRAVVALLGGDLAAFRRLWPHPASAVDQRFREYLRGKSVAVVGPAPTGSADGAEIDGFDVVVRMNWRGPESVADAGEFGSKTQVALYNAHTVRLLQAEGRLGLVKALDFCLIRRPRYDLEQLDWDAGRVRMLAEYPGAFYKSLNAVPAVVFDLLLHGAERIKLFKVNFYLGERQHAQGYRGRADGELAAMPLRRLQPVMANHDIANLKFIVDVFLKQKSLNCTSSKEQHNYISNLTKFVGLATREKKHKLTVLSHWRKTKSDAVCSTVYHIFFCKEKVADADYIFTGNTATAGAMSAEIKRAISKHSTVLANGINSLVANFETLSVIEENISKIPKFIIYIHECSLNLSKFSKHKKRDEMYAAISRMGKRENVIFWGVSPLAKEAVAAFFDIPKDKIFVIENSVRKNNLFNTRRFDERADRFIIFSSGTISKEKGADYFKKIASEKKLLPKLIDAEWAYHNSLADYSNIFRGAGNVKCLDYLNSFLEKLTTVDLVIITTRGDGQSLVAWEALSVDCPVISFDNAGAAMYLPQQFRAFSYDDLVEKINSFWIDKKNYAPGYFKAIVAPYTPKNIYEKMQSTINAEILLS